jgi:hypothetical protein
MYKTLSAKAIPFDVLSNPLSCLTLSLPFSYETLLENAIPFDVLS